MFFNKKKLNENSGLTTQSLRRRFNHVLLRKRKGADTSHLSASMDRPRRRFAGAFGGNAKMHKWQRVGYWAIIAGMLFFIFYLVIFSTFFDIKKASLQKNGHAVNETAFAPFLERMKGKNLLFLNFDSLEREIENSFLNEIEDVKIKSSFPDKAIIEVKEYPAVLNLNIHTAEKDVSVVINRLGYIIAENSEQKDVPTLKVEMQKPPLKVAPVLEKEKLEQILGALQKWDEYIGMKIAHGVWLKRERELHLTTEKNFSVWLDMMADMPKQIEKLKRALPKLDIWNEPLAYVDLRISGGENEKVIFKRR